jgi:hypothetical protein
MTDNKEIKQQEDNDIKQDGNLRFGIYNQKLEGQPISEGQIAWRIDNMYKDEQDFKVRGKLSMIKEPPILVIENAEGQKANFILTKKLTDDLTKTLTLLDNKYKGKSNKKRMKIKDIKNIFKNWKEWSIESLALLVCIVVLIINIFI